MREQDDEGEPIRPEPGLPLDMEQTMVAGSSGAGAGASDLAPDFRPQIEGYTNLLELHRGGQGIVYRGWQISTRRMVAIKVLREGPHADPATRKRFQREVEIVAQLNHPNIVSIFDSGVTATGLPYFVMEYVHGREFDRYIHEENRSVEDTLTMMRVILDAAHHAHERGVVHRDLKPSNILVDADGQPKLVDFGLARALVTKPDSFASLTGQVLGTMAYMAPEQVRANPDEIDRRTDVYALGVILYEILTGASPYPESTRIVEILQHITDTSPKLPGRAWSSGAGLHRRSERRRSLTGKCPIDSELETILLEAMAKERERRYPSAHDFAADIGRYLEGRPIEARRDSGVYVLRKKLQRHRRTVAAVLLAAVLFAAGLVLVPRPGGAPERKLAPEEIARYESAEAAYVKQRDELRGVLEARVAAGDVQLDPLTQESLHIVEDAVRELRAALEKDPNNQDLRELLLRTYGREVELLKRVSALPAAS